MAQVGTLVSIPGAVAAVGKDAADASVLVELVNARGVPVQGLTAGAPIAEARLFSLDPVDGLVLDLVPQSAITNDAATYYRLTIAARVGTEVVTRSWLVQVPAVPTSVTLADLVGGASVDPADILAGRLFPVPGDLPDGAWLSVRDGAWAASDALRPAVEAIPATAGDLVFALPNDETLTLKVKGLDGIVRSVALTLTEPAP